MLRGKKIVLGYEIKEGPWGGGNQFLISVKNHFLSLGAQVVHHLEEGADVIFIINPNPASGTINLAELKKYKQRNRDAIIIHRVNETSKAKHFLCGINRLRRKANALADAVVYISDWVRRYYEKPKCDSSQVYVVHNGPDRSAFNSSGYLDWDGKGPLKVVTHHWSDNVMKGSDVYKKFDKLLSVDEVSQQFTFTYVGRPPKNVFFKNTKLIAPLSGNELAAELKRHHVYLTAARWESCGMHQLEGALCGLPVLYINEGGGVVETCKGFGLEYSKKSFEQMLFKMKENYSAFREKMSAFSYDSERMCTLYEMLVKECLQKKADQRIRLGDA